MANTSHTVADAMRVNRPAKLEIGYYEEVVELVLAAG
jgi:hypothetical protein